MRFLYFLKSILVDLFAFFHTVNCVVLSLLSALVFPSRRYYQDQVIFFWAKGLIFLFQLEVSIYGKKNLPGKKGVLYLFNHTSFLDIPMIHFVLPHVRFGAKDRLFNIPLFGYTLKKIGSLVIERKTPRKVFGLYKKSVQRVLSGESFALAPEGTRQDGSRIKPFKRGPFLFALEGGLDLVPVVLHGVHRVWPKGKKRIYDRKKKRKIVIHILPPVSTQSMDKTDLNILKERVQKDMSQVYNDLGSKDSF